MMKINFNFNQNILYSDLKTILVHKIVFEFLSLIAKDQSINTFTFGLNAKSLIFSKFWLLTTCL